MEEIDEHIKKIETINNAITFLHHNKNENACFYFVGEVGSEDVLNEELKKTLPQCMIPALFIKVGDFLYTNNNKIDRNSMSKKYLEYASMDERVFNEAINIHESIIDILLIVTGKSKNDVQLNKSFDSLGIDSIQFVQFVIEIEKRLGIEVPDELLVMEQFVDIEEFLNQIYILNY